MTKGPTHALYARVMYANLASIMPQVIAVWCEEEGHEVTFICYTGFENLVDEFHGGGATGICAEQPISLKRCCHSPRWPPYPQDAGQYFDYVLGFTDKTVIRQVLQDCQAATYEPSRGT
ncbi:MAG: hypothetical protein DMG05_22825 [Acidobacteria bacterium]|nr:MAG: hypothetical protein DMG05_22825 [Acidobacteriota bacterium]